MAWFNLWFGTSYYDIQFRYSLIGIERKREDDSNMYLCKHMLLIHWFFLFSCLVPLLVTNCVSNNVDTALNNH